MRRVAPNLPVSPVMLRHFAVVTLVATAGLAMFASGENSSALAEAQRAAQARGGGAWGTSPRKPSENKTATTVNGMHVAAGTRLEPDSVKRRVRGEYAATLRDRVGGTVLQIVH